MKHETVILSLFSNRDHVRAYVTLTYMISHDNVGSMMINLKSNNITRNYGCRTRASLSGYPSPDVRDYFTPGCGENDIDGEVAALWGSGTDGGRGAGASQSAFGAF